MKKQMINKIVAVVATTSLCVLMNTTNIYAAPGFDMDGFKKFVTMWTDPITGALVWLAPSVGIIALIVYGIKYYGKEENERKWGDFLKNISLIIGITVVITSATIIFRIFGLDV